MRFHLRLPSWEDALPCSPCAWRPWVQGYCVLSPSEDTPSAFFFWMQKLQSPGRDEAGSCRLTLSSNVCGTRPVFHLPLILRVPCAAVPRFSRGPAGAPACILASPLQAPGVCFLCCTTLWYRRRVQTDLSCPIHCPFFRCRSEERLSRRSGDTRIYLTHHVSSGRLYTAIISSFLSHHSFSPSLSYA